MKKLMYLFVAAIMFVFTACTGEKGSTKKAEKAVVEQVSVCSDDCQNACCLGCKATKGRKKCIILADGSMPCCIVKSDANEHYDE